MSSFAMDAMQKKGSSRVSEDEHHRVNTYDDGRAHHTFKTDTGETNISVTPPTAVTQPDGSVKFVQKKHEAYLGYVGVMNAGEKYIVGEKDGKHVIAVHDGKGNITTSLQDKRKTGWKTAVRSSGAFPSSWMKKSSK